MKNARINRHRLVGAPLVAAALFHGTPAFAQGESPQAAEIDKLFGWVTPSSPGCTCAVSLNGQLIVNRAYGSADLERDAPISTGSIFDAGSLLKQFVAAAVLVLVDEKKIALTDDIRTYIPELPDYGRTITVDHLLTHTSGLRDWNTMIQLTGSKEDALTLILRQRGLNHPPGEECFYTSSGVVLAREIVARTSGMSFGEFTRTRMFEPLGMKSTSFRENMREVVKNRALAYDKEDYGWRMAALLDNDRGGGGVLTTAADLVTWSDAIGAGRLGAFVTEKLREPARLSNGRKLSYTRGLFIDTTPEGDTFYWHTGSADGYKSALCSFPSHGLSVAIMCNSGDGTDRIEAVRRILDLFVPAEADARAGVKPPPAAAEDVDVASLDLGSRAGLFVSEGAGEALQLAVQGGRLRAIGGPPLTALSQDRFRCARPSLFFMSNDEFEIRFLSRDELELKSMEGQTTRYRRAEPYAPSADDLKALAGRYGSDEIGTVFGIEPQGDGLAVSLGHAPGRSIGFKPVRRDMFQFSQITVRFRRDGTGAVVGLDFSNPFLRNIPFTRLSDGR